MPDPEPPSDPAPPTRRIAAPQDAGYLLHKHHGVFRRLADHLLRRRSHAREQDATDLVNQASLEFLGRERSWRSETHFVNLFRRFVLGAARDARKRDGAQKRGGEVAKVPLPSSSGVQPVAGSGPGTAAGRSEEQEIVVKALQRLSEEYRKVIILRLWDNLPFDAVAERLELESPDAARMRYQRAMTKLKEAVAWLRRQGD